jgi:hypothetical protein
MLRRGSAGGTTIESVNMMIGIMLMELWKLVPEAPILLMPAAQWKNALNRVTPIEAVYEKSTNCTPHQVDAFMIGMYAADYFSRQPPFKTLSKRIASSIAKTRID